MPTETHFSREALRFLVELSLNNRRDWFEPRKTDYLRLIREPLRALALELKPILAGISPHFVSDPRVQGGSLLRVHRDLRFSVDQRPYKSWAALKLFHQRSRLTEAPSFYLHFEPGRSFVGAGLWRPGPETLRRIRAFLVDNPQAWRNACRRLAPHGRFAPAGTALARVPRGYDANHPLIEDLKRRDFVIVAPLADAELLRPGLSAALGERLSESAPYVDYLCAALDLEF